MNTVPDLLVYWWTRWVLNRNALATSRYVGGLDGGSGTVANLRPSTLISGTTITMGKERVIQVEVLRLEVEPWLNRGQIYMSESTLSHVDEKGSA